jgi:hypothetical protein
MKEVFYLLFHLLTTLAKLQQLEEQGIESYVIGGGELEGNISLGLFTSRDRAEARPLQESRLPVVIHSRQRRQNQTWLRLDSAAVQALGWSPDLADLTLWPRPAILGVECPGQGEP